MRFFFVSIKSNYGPFNVPLNVPTELPISQCVAIECRARGVELIGYECKRITREEYESLAS